MNNLGYVPHNEAIAHQRKSQVLLLIEIDSEETKSIIPGKLFEYMATGNPILAVGPADADVKKILQKTKAGDYFSHQQVNEIKTYILSIYNQWLKNPNQKFETNEEEVQQFNRKNLTKKLVEVVGKL